MKMKCLMLMLCALLTGCSSFPLDFGGDDAKDWEWRWGWEGSKPPGQPSDEQPPFEVPAEVAATYAFPDVTAGSMYMFNGGDSRLTPLIGLEVAEMKVPFARWFSWQVVTGDDAFGLLMQKRLTSIYEVTAGVGMIYDLANDEWVPAAAFTLTNF